MKVEDVMGLTPRTCEPDDDLGRASIEMWHGDCGMLPVVWSERVVGVVTDRDICMGLALEGCAPGQRRVRDVMSREVHVCAPGDDLSAALTLMARRKVHRLPVVDGDRLVGVLSMSDVLRHLDEPGHPQAREVVTALRAITAPRSRKRARRPRAAPVRT
jgi:CBS domain-containing protein